MSAANIADVSEVILLLGLSSPTDDERALAEWCLRAATAAVSRHIGYDPVYAERTEYYPQLDVTRTSRDSVWEATDTVAFQRMMTVASADQLQLSRLPLRSVTALYIDYDARSGTRDASFGAATQKVQGTDFWPQFDAVDSDGNAVATDGILRSEGLWPAKAGSVKVVYYAGYRPNEFLGSDPVLDASPLRVTAVEEAVRRFFRAKSRAKRRLAGFAGPLTSEKLGDYSYNADAPLLASLVGGVDLDPASVDRLQPFVNYGSSMAS